MDGSVTGTRFLIKSAFFGNSSVQNILNILYYTPMVSVKGDEICKYSYKAIGHISSLKNEEIKIWEAKIMIES